jgi:hypothetical protein
MGILGAYGGMQVDGLLLIVVGRALAAWAVYGVRMVGASIDEGSAQMDVVAQCRGAGGC